MDLKDKIITLDNESEYGVFDEIEFNGGHFVFLVNTDIKKKDAKILKAEYEEDRLAFLEIDELLRKELLEMFFVKNKDRYNELTDDDINDFFKDIN